MGKPRFVHLRMRSDFSLVDGLAKVEALVAEGAKQQVGALALTDFFNVCGWVQFSRAARRAGIKPLVGADLRCAGVALPGYYPMTLLAVDEEGYRQLLLLLSRAHLRGHLGHAPAIERAWLEPSSGLIMLSGGMAGEFGCAVLQGERAAAAQVLRRCSAQFGDRFYVELQRLGEAGEGRYEAGAIALARVHEVPLVATHPIRFLSPDDFEAHNIRVAIHDKCSLASLIAAPRYSKAHCFRSEAEMVSCFSDLPEALANSVVVAQRCSVDLRLGQIALPQLSGALSPSLVLQTQAREGLARRGLSGDRYTARLERELTVILEMGFSSYFLVVAEFVQWARQAQIPVGPGRGSGAGSLVAYALHITDIDPLPFGLLFERLLNPGRVSLPDFDIDFCMEKRDQVIEHMVQRYGQEAVAQIITFGSMTARAVIRDVGRVLGHPYGFVDRIAKLVPFDVGIVLDQALADSTQLKALYDEDEEVRALLNLCKRLEGVRRNAGKHAGGVVVAPGKITDFTAIYCDASGQHPVTQFDKNDIEAVGLVKFDFLGLRTLTILDWAMRSINQAREASGETPLCLTQIPLDDAASFALLKRTETVAVFQLESRGMRELIHRLQPDTFEELIALLALFRPGPLQSGMVDNFIDRKHGRERVAYPDTTYEHPLLQPILEETYGIILYQEQAMQIAQVLAGYSLQDADLLRRAIGKKKPQEMAAQRARFGEGALAQEIDRTLAMKIFDLVEKFSGYGFNKSHSAAYAMLSYQTLFLKAHYPLPFMAAVLTADMDNTDKLMPLIEEVSRMGLRLRPPDVSLSAYGFTVDASGALVYGLGAIKGVGRMPIEALLLARARGGAFKSLSALCEGSTLTRGVIEKLIDAGACDCFGTTRGSLLQQLPQALRRGQADPGQGLLFEPSEDPACAALVDGDDVLAREYAVLGCYLSGHPMDHYRSELLHYGLMPLGSGERSRARIAGLVLSCRMVKSKRGSAGCLVVLDTGPARVEALFLEEVLTRCQPLLQVKTALVLEGEGRRALFSGRARILVKRASTLADCRTEALSGITLELEAASDVEECSTLQALQALLSSAQRPEGVVVSLHYRRGASLLLLRLASTPVCASDLFLSGCRSLCRAVQLHWRG